QSARTVVPFVVTLKFAAPGAHPLAIETKGSSSTTSSGVDSVFPGISSSPCTTNRPEHEVVPAATPGVQRHPITRGRAPRTRFTLVVFVRMVLRIIVVPSFRFAGWERQQGRCHRNSRVIARAKRLAVNRTWHAVHSDGRH